MTRSIDIDQARQLLRSREDLHVCGYSDRDVRAAVASGELHRLYRGWHVDRAPWESMWMEGRHLLRVAAVEAAAYGEPVFAGLSAAAIWGMPIYGHSDFPVHTLEMGRRHARTQSGVVRHAMHVHSADVVEYRGLKVTSPLRTVFDVARTESRERAVSIADAALRREAVRGHVHDEGAASDWRERLARLDCAGLRGVRQARWVAQFADGRAQLPGESVSRLQLHRLGFRDIPLQVPVIGADGDQYFADFAFPRSRAFGEFDGRSKYVDPGLRGEASAQDVVLAEKRREDDLRGVTGWRVVRWASEHVKAPDALGRRLAAFGIYPPG